MSIRPPRAYRSAYLPGMIREVATIALICTAVAVTSLRFLLRAMEVSLDTNGARLVHLLTGPPAWVLYRVPTLDGILLGAARFADAALLFMVLVVAAFALASMANRRPFTD